MEILDISHTDEIYTVSRLNREVRLVLEGSFATLWVEGEISNFMCPHSGHWYFSLKDPISQVRCAMFRTQNRRTGFQPKDGMQVLIKARISLYEGRGEFQLLVEHMEEAGEGKLRQEFEALKKRLLEAGLFAEEHKKKLPLLPKKIGVITSPTGAAIRDILSVLNRRFACAQIIIYPSLVQGETAAANIVRMIQIANLRRECDVLILARGGGSLEDLWPFNEEIVAHAIFHSELPIISGVGHEIDFTIADFVADVRAPTPSAAAELITPNLEEMLDALKQNERHLLRLMQQKIRNFQQNLVWIKKHLQQQHPKRRLAEQAQRLDLAEMSLTRLQVKLLTAYQAKLHTLTARLYGATPRHQIREAHHQINHALKILNSLTLRAIHKQEHALGSLAAKLDALSPLSTLKRGYAIATRDSDKHVLLRAVEVNTGDKIHVKLMEGELDCLVNKVLPNT